MKDWKTSLVGLVVILVGAIHMLQSKQMDSQAMGMLTGGVGLILASDQKKDS